MDAKYVTDTYTLEKSGGEIYNCSLNGGVMCFSRSPPEAIFYVTGIADDNVLWTRQSTLTQNMIMNLESTDNVIAAFDRGDCLWRSIEEYNQHMLRFAQEHEPPFCVVLSHGFGYYVPACSNYARE